MSRDVPGQRVLSWDICSCLCPGTKGHWTRKNFCPGTEGQRDVPSGIVLGRTEGLPIPWKPYFESQRHFLIPPHYTRSQNSLALLRYADFESKIFPILYPPLENLTTHITMIGTFVIKGKGNIFFAFRFEWCKFYNI